MRRLLAYLFLLPFSIFLLSAYDVEVDGISYNLVGSSSAYVTHCGTYNTFEPNGYAGEVVVPEQIVCRGNTYNVIAVGPSAFADCEGLTSVQLSSSVRGISACAFLGCTKLQQVTHPNTVQGVAACAFTGCTSLQEFSFSHRLELVDSLVLYCCASLSSVVLPHCVRTVCQGALQHLPSMTDLYVFADRPPQAEQGSFTLDDQQKCTLHVPADAVSLYQESPVWKDFYEIVELTDDEYKLQGYLRGDINDDGLVDASDLALLRRLVVSLQEKATVRWSADINGDGRVNAVDYVMLSMKLSD